MFDDINRYEVVADNSHEPKPMHRSFGEWSVRGRGAGNRKEDRLEAPEEGGAPEISGSKASGAPDVAEASLEGIDTTTVGAREGETGTYRETTYGTVVEGGEKGFKPELKYDPEENAWVVDVYSGRAAAGAREKVGVRGSAEAENDWGSAAAKGDAYLSAETGADANLTLNTSDGLQASTAAHVKAGAGAEGDADLKTRGWAIEGVSDPVDAGIGAHGEVFVGAKAGLGGKVGVSPEWIGAEGKMGAFAGAELEGDVHGNLGPVEGKLGGSLMAGAGAGMEGAIVLEDWKLRIGGKMYAALGYGGSVSGEVTVDLKQAVELGVAGAKELYEVADADKDKRLTLNDPATHTALAMQGGAELADKATDGLIQFLDADKDKKFSREDLEKHAARMGEVLGDAKERIVTSAGELLGKTHDALDWDNDQQLGLSDVKGAAEAARDAVTDTFEAGASKAHSFLDHDKDQKLELSDVTAHLGDAGTAVLDTGKKVSEWAWNAGAKAVDFVGDEAQSAGKAMYDAADLNHDNKVDAGDAGVAGAKLWQGVKDVGRSVSDSARSAMDSVHDLLDLNDDQTLDSGDATVAMSKMGQAAKAAQKSAVDTFHKTVKAAHGAYQSAEKAFVGFADRDGDKQLDSDDLVAGVKQVGGAAKKGLQTAAKVAHDTLDVDGDDKLSLNDAKVAANKTWDAVSTGASKTADAVVGGAKALYKEGEEQLTKAGETLSEGYKAAAASLKSTWGKVTSFFDW
jgi:hypothetical protein